ncbi:hypothetical protein CC79DRAFT_1320361 [Sarocladium strictum]
MTRRLPWKKEEAAAGSPSSAVKRQRDSPRTAGVKREAAASSSPSVHKKLPVTPRRRAINDRDVTRSPSTSPPPEPIKEELMIAGLDDDDRYRMVEDEFISVAHRFTTHLHRAEYSRLRALAASQNAEAIREIARPVVGGSHLTADAIRRAEGRRRDARQRTVLGRPNEDEAEAATGLRGLLESPRKARRRIGVGLGREGMKTRAYAGLGARVARDEPAQRSARTDGDATEDDETADEPELPPLRTTSGSRSIEQSSVIGSRGHRTPRPGESSASKSMAAGTTTTRVATKPASPEVIEIDDDDDDPFGLSRRKARRAKSREQLRRPASEVKPERDTMPSFL